MNAAMGEEPADPAEPGAAAAGTAAPPGHGRYDVFRDAGFRSYILAGMAVTIGTQMQGVAVGWEIYERTGSKLALGMVGLAQVLPVLLLAIPSGHTADRYSRKWQMVAALCVLVGSSLGLAWLSISRGPVGWIYVFLVLNGIGQSFNRPARWAILREIVDRDRLVPAITWNTSTWQVAAVAGPALGGLLVAQTGGATASYLGNAACCALGASLIMTLRPRPIAREVQPISLETLLAGIRFVFRTDLLLATMTLDLFAVLLGGATALLPVFASDILGTGPVGLGWLRAAPSIGSFLMALAMAHLPPLRRAGVTLLGAVVGFGLATIVFGLSTNPYLSFAMLLITGMCDNVSVVVRQTLAQLLTPEGMRGRVSAVNTIFITSSNELGEFESGVAASWLGTVPAVVVGGVGTILVVLSVAARWPRLATLGRLGELQPPPDAVAESVEEEREAKAAPP
ncbi:Enterobactin exporter EntS [Aquisphaera giovannonii]|uniref:Enterobactin exporter EntS n=1 Tax=Aquisphaera giovannonii TaxID=406548 RepID=A0A5B9W3V0_9BACT|nr:MFS transporter [Aquisphaera giovannonii]QEH34765.1 Enterobactin exporter EntS [Aquisphaera giovannonii]